MTRAAPNRVQYQLRFSEDLRVRLRACADARGTSINSEIIDRLERSLWFDDLLKARLISIRVPASKKPETG